MATIMACGKRIFTPSLISRFAQISTIRSKYTLPELPYAYNALEPIISAEIMELHHSKHHATYVNNLNATSDKLAEALSKKDKTTAISLQPALVFNGGGHINHSIFWKNLSPSGGKFITDGPLAEEITKTFGSFDVFRKVMSDTTIAVQGSGWGWLGMSVRSGRLHVRSCRNQDPLLPTTEHVPLLGIDVWEHAYYLQYKNARPDYVNKIWDVINWKDVEERFVKARAEFA